jgi:RNA polymerase sigma-70 factor (ECF subfamily)
VFRSTHWSVVLTAGHESAPRAQEAQAYLCSTYWKPVYVFIRRQGYSPEDAEDHTQEFFARLLRNQFLVEADPAKGRFRGYLLTAVKHFLISEHRREHSMKRGGSYRMVPLETAVIEGDLAGQTPAQLSPEKLFDRAWAWALLDRVLARLEAEQEASGNVRLFKSLKPGLIGERVSADYAALATEFETTETALRMTVYRLRQRFGKLVRQEIALTVTGRHEVEDELRYLVAALTEM